MSVFALNEEPTSLREEQRKLAESIKRLLGASPAACYRDACRLIGPPVDSRLECTPFLIPFLLRQVEQKLRAVLLPLEFVPLADRDTRVQEVAEIAAAQKLDTEVRERWRRCIEQIEVVLEDASEDPSRATMLGALLTECEKLFGALLEVLGRSYLEIVHRIDTLPAKPSAKALRALLDRLPESAVVHDHLLKKLPRDGLYLEELRRAGFFRRPPAPTREKNDPQMDPRWVALSYLEALAGTHAREVGLLLRDLPATENVTVHTQMAAVALKLPAPIAADWTLREVGWLRTHSRDRVQLHRAFTPLAAALLQQKQLEAGQELLRVLFSFSAPSDETGSERAPHVDTYWPLYSRRTLLEKCVPPLLEASPGAALDFLCDALVSVANTRSFFYVAAIDLSTEMEEVVPSRLADENLLVDAARKAAEKLADSEPLDRVVARIERHPGSLFRRLALHLLRRRPQGMATLIQKYLLDEEALYSSKLEPEYSQLLGEQLGQLTKSQQQNIISRILKGPSQEDLARYSEDGPEHSARARYVETWTYRRLAALMPSLPLLPDVVKRRYEELHRLYAPQPAQPPTHQATPDELLSLNPQALKALLLEAGGGQEEIIREPRHELTRALRQAVARDPQRFAEWPGFFGTVHRDFVAAFFGGLEDALRAQQGTVTQHVLLLMKEVLSQQETSPAGRAAKPAWQQFHLNAAHVLRVALSQRDRPLLSLSNFDLLFEILGSLLFLPFHSQVQPRSASELKLDAHSIASALINSPRGVAFESLLEADSWLQRDRESQGQPRAPLSQLFNSESLLNRLLSEQEPLLQGAFGGSVLTLFWLDARWTFAKLTSIFPTQPAARDLFSAAWAMYLAYGGGYPQEGQFASFRFAYEHAVDRLEDQPAAEGSSGPDSEQRMLAGHLAGLYLDDLLDLTPGDLLDRFFKRATDSLCAVLMESVGQLVERSRSRRTDEEGSAGIADKRDRAESLWKVRSDVIFANRDLHREEAGAFLAYFVSEAFEPAWALQQLQGILPFADYDAADAMRMQDRLAALAPEYPVECMNSLHTYLQRAGFLININTEAAKAVFDATLHSLDQGAARLARDWINLLVASGIAEEELPSLRDALPQQDASPAAPIAQPTGSRDSLLARVSVKGFKSLADLDLELGLFNVFIGANGSGKTNLLEALGVLGAALEGGVLPEHLAARGVRASPPVLFKSSFAGQELRRLITLAAHFTDSTMYQLGLENPIDQSERAWRIFSERFEQEGGKRKFLRRSPRACILFDAIDERRIDNPIATETYAASAAKENPDAAGAQGLMAALTRYAIFSLNTPVLRGLAPDRERAPLGLSGGGLPGALRELLTKDRLGAFDRDDVLALLGWAAEISVVPSAEAVLSSAVHGGPLVVQFKDRYMKRGRDLLSGYDANEGALYILFYLALASHRDAPRLCAIDDFDHCLNPLLACHLTEMLTRHFVADGSRQWLVTTHNPLVLDGLDLSDDRIRLFAVDRDDSGMTHVKRVVVDPELLTKHAEGYALSNLWVMGRLGGLPKNL